MNKKEIKQAKSTHARKWLIENILLHDLSILLGRETTNISDYLQLNYDAVIGKDYGFFKILGAKKELRIGKKGKTILVTRLVCESKITKQKCLVKPSNIFLGLQWGCTTKDLIERGYVPLETEEDSDESQPELVELTTEKSEDTPDVKTVCLSALDSLEEALNALRKLCCSLWRDEE